MKFPHYLQQDQMDCGATCLRIISKYYGRNISIQKLRRLCQVTKNGVNLLGISDAAEKIGFRTQGIKLGSDQLEEIPLPCLAHWRQNHFVVLLQIKKGKYYVSDPATGVATMTKEEFTRNWFPSANHSEGVVLQITPSPTFYEQEEDDIQSKTLGWKTILQYFYVYRRLLLQLVLGLLIGTILQLITPFLTQSVVDIGINTRNINFIYLILLAQIMLFIGQTSVTFIRSWILLHISTRVNISILTDLLIKLMKLPMEFFEAKTTGDIMQRMNDQSRIESFLTGSTLNTLFSLFNLLVFGLVLSFYNMGIFVVFVGSTILYTLWILLFLKRRRELDIKRFDISSENQTKMIELVNSMQEIKLTNSEKQKRWLWETIQARLFKFKVQSLALSQYQQAGSMAINQLKSIVITFMSAKAVIEGDLTLGGMMAIQYIVGMINSPVEQFLGFIQSYQDAKISLERINEIYNEEDEQSMKQDWIDVIPENNSIHFKNTGFRYPGAGNDAVLENINLVFPQGKTTALVGVSGCGKTTMLKLIMRFYKPSEGEILVGNTRLNQIDFKVWREECGVVMQDGFIFADTIENNIAVGDENPDYQKIIEAIKVANLKDFIEEQPYGLKTKIGIAGKGISQGQKQRLLIARAVYKNPKYILFDEATNALDARNESIIINNLKNFFVNRTVIIVAHRLSTVSNADNIIVIKKGGVVEQGSHLSLIKLKGEYYSLIKNQLELRG